MKITGRRKGKNEGSILMIHHIGPSDGKECEGNPGIDGKDVLDSEGMISASEFFAKKQNESSDMKNASKDQAKDVV